MEEFAAAVRKEVSRGGAKGSCLEASSILCNGPRPIQMLLLPEVVDDYVGPDNPVRFIDAFVDGLDLAAASFRGVEPKVTGRPGYGPADLLKLYIYGYRARSSRRLEAETHRYIAPARRQPARRG